MKEEESPDLAYFILGKKCYELEMKQRECAKLELKYGKLAMDLLTAEESKRGKIVKDMNKLEKKIMLLSKKIQQNKLEYEMFIEQCTRKDKFINKFC